MIDESDELRRRLRVIFPSEFFMVNILSVIPSI